MGMLFRRGNVWWIKYYRNGKSYRESSGSTKKMVAQKSLNQREGEIAQGKVPGIYFDKVTFDELAGDFIVDYKINQRKTLNRAELSVKHLKEFLRWKETIGESTSEKEYLFVSKRKSQYSTRALQVMFKNGCKRAGLSEEYSIHSCRHSYGTYLYQKTRNLRLVMKELRHRNIQTTTVYSDVVPEDAVEGVNGVWE